MLFVALWLEALWISVLWAALVDAVVARWSRRWRWSGLAVSLAPLVYLIALAVFAGRMELGTKIRVPLHLFQPLVALTILSLAAGVGLWWFGFGGQSSGNLLAASWPRLNLALALAVCVGLLLTSLGVWESEVRGQGAVARLEAEALSESLAPPKIADRDNAAPIYTVAYQSMTDEGKLPEFIAKVVDDTLASPPAAGVPLDLRSPELVACLEGHAELLAQLRAAAARLGCRFPYDYRRMTLTTESQLPSLVVWRDLGFLLLADARYHAASDDSRAALADIQAAFVMADLIDDRTSSRTIVCLFIKTCAADTLETILQNETFSSADLNLLELEGGESFRDRLSTDLRALEATGMKTFAPLMEGLESPEMAAIKGTRRVPWLAQYLLMPADYQGFCREKDRMIAAINSTGGYQSIIDELGNIVAEPASGAFSFLSQMSVAPMFEKAMRMDAKLAVTRTGVALHRYRAVHGKFPPSLDDLAAEFLIPADPYDDKPIRFKTTDQGWVVYSIGPDLLDNGGKRYDNSTKTGDIVFEYRGGK